MLFLGIRFALVQPMRLLGSFVLVLSGLISPLQSAEARVCSSTQTTTSENGKTTITANLIDSQTMKIIEKKNDDELASVPKAEHRSSIRLHWDQQQNPIKTKKSVLIFHGLLNSPRWMKAIEDGAFEQGYNVYNLRLSKHHENDRFALDTAKYEEWVAQSQEALALASKIGEKVVVVGHSTGGVLAQALAIENSKTVDSALLIAPALRLNRILEKVLITADEYGVSGRHLESLLSSQFDKYLSTQSGLEVIELGNWFRKLVEKYSDEDGLLNQISNWPKDRYFPIRVEIVDTGADKIIDPEANLVFSEKIKKSPRHFFVTYQKLSWWYGIKHDELPQGIHDYHDDYILGSLNKLLNCR
jgi:esterase/lipase